MTSDSELLQRYVHAHDEGAFRELVRRHIDFVFAAAARQARNPSRAEDIAQQVFVDLARKASRLVGRREIVSWLYLSTRYTTLRLLRSEARRQAREQEAQMMEPLSEQPDWPRLRPVIDEALNRLGEGDRSVILLRYFRNLSYPEIAEVLRSSDGTVRRRADRALGKLRRALARGGIACSAEALVQMLEAQPPISSPAGLAMAAGDAAMKSSAAVQIATSRLLQGFRFLNQSGFLAAGLGTAALFMAGLTWRAHAAIQKDLLSAAAEKSSNERAVARLAAANKAADDAQQSYDRLNAQYRSAQKRAQVKSRANGTIPTSTDPELQRLAILKLNTLHAETDMPFLRQMGWPPDKIQTFLDYEAVESRITGLVADGVDIMIRDNQHLLRNAVSDGAPDNGRQGDLLESWLGADAGKFDDFLRHNNSYDIAGRVAEQLQAVEPLSSDQADALTQAFLRRGISIEPSDENWNRILEASTGILSPAQLEMVQQYATLATGGNFETPAP